MNRRGGLVIAAVCALLGVAVAIACLRGPREPQEPQYQGEKLSWWLELGYGQSHGSERELAARDALEHIGTNAFPSVLNWISYQPSERRARKIQLATNLDIPLLKFAAMRVLEGNKAHRAGLAEFWFEEMKSDAMPVEERLKSLAQDGCRRAGDALYWVRWKDDQTATWWMLTNVLGAGAK